MSKICIIAEIGCNHNGDKNLAKKNGGGSQGMWCGCCEVSNI